MKYFAFFVLSISMAVSKPVHEEAIVDVVSDNNGHYKYTFKSTNITINEERNVDGSVIGSYSYLDEFGETQSIYYTSGVEGFVAVGTTIPVDGPEVVEARNAHLAIVENLRSILPPLKEGETVNEKDIVPLTKEELLAAVESVVNTQDTQEVAEAKGAFLNLYRAALAS